MTFHALKPRSPLANDALAHAMTPAAVKKPAGYYPRQLLDFVDIAEVQPRDLLIAGLRLEAAGELRAQAQEMTTMALSVMANPEHFNHRRLVKDDGTTRKPRVMLWAEVNAAGTLQVFWNPVRDEQTLYSERQPCAGTDYIEMVGVWNEHGVGSNVILRFRDRAYLRQPAWAGDVQTHLLKGADDALRSALAESLSRLLEALSLYCNVQVEEWPEYDEQGRLELISVVQRARRGLLESRGPIAKKAARLKAEVDDKLSRLGLSSPGEFDTAAAQAAAEGSKVTAVLFKTTGRRSTSLQTDSLCERLEALRSCQAELARVEEALASLAP